MAFTLIELLVVVSIITLLIAILLPSLGRARHTAKKAVCLSNQRQIAIGMRSYASEYGDRVPLIFGNSKQYNIDFWYGGNGTATYQPRWRGQGLLYSLGLVTDPKAFRCPSETEPRFILGTTKCPWPVQNLVATESAYGCRPMVNALYSTAGYDSGFKNWPMFITLANQAIVADVLLAPYLDSRHVTGVNVAYTDGSANWVDRARFNTDLMLYPWFSYMTPYGTQADAKAQERIWAVLDQR